MIYAVSDIHGNKARFENILKQIRLQPNDRLYVLGDVIDRGEHGIELLDRIRQMPNATMLLGNHEYMMRSCLENPDDEQAARRWNRNGNQPTIAALEQRDEDYKRDLIRYLHEIPVEITITVNRQNYTLVHAAPSVLFEKGDQCRYNDPTEFSVWYRMPIFRQDLDENTTVVFGHTPTENFQKEPIMTVWKGDHRIDIDCGCSNPRGRLACLRLDDGKVFYSKDIKPGRFQNNLYLTERLDYSTFRHISSKDGTLFSDYHRTKIKPEDLPPWYIHGRYYKIYGYLSTKGIRHMVYTPVLENHFIRDDQLLISYSTKIVPKTDDPQSFEKYDGYDERVYGFSIIDVLKGARKYSDYNIDLIVQQIKDKAEWLWENFPEDAKHECPDDIDALFEE